MRAGIAFGVDNSMDLFAKLNRQIYEFADRWAEYVAPSKSLPNCSLPSDATSPVGWIASRFTSPEDYAMLSLLPIINSHLCKEIFHPFHPMASEEQNSIHEQNYQTQAQEGECFPICLGL